MKLYHFNALKSILQQPDISSFAKKVLLYSFCFKNIHTDRIDNKKQLEVTFTLADLMTLTGTASRQRAAENARTACKEINTIRAASADEIATTRTADTTKPQYKIIKATYRQGVITVIFSEFITERLKHFIDLPPLYWQLDTNRHRHAAELLIYLSSQRGRNNGNCITIKSIAKSTTIPTEDDRNPKRVTDTFTKNMNALNSVIKWSFKNGKQPKTPNEFNAAKIYIEWRNKDTENSKKSPEN